MPGRKEQQRKQSPYSRPCLLGGRSGLSCWWELVTCWINASQNVPYVGHKDSKSHTEEDNGYSRGQDSLW